MADEPNLKTDTNFARDNWEWLSDKRWVWLTNCDINNIELIMQVEEMYGQENVQISGQAYDNNRVPLSGKYIALFVDRKAFKKQFDTGEGILPKGD